MLCAVHRGGLEAISLCQMDIQLILALINVLCLLIHLHNLANEQHTAGGMCLVVVGLLSARYEQDDYHAYECVEDEEADDGKK